MKNLTGDKIAAISAIPILLLILISLAVAAWPQPRPFKVDVGFIGFTNTGHRVEAIFGITNTPRARMAWRAPFARGDRTVKSIWTKQEAWGTRIAMSMPEEEQSLIMVFIFRVNQRSIGLKRVMERVRELAGRITGRRVDFFTGPVSDEVCEIPIHYTPP